MQAQYTLTELADILGAELVGDANCPIHSIATLEQAGEGQLSFIASPAFKKHLAQCAASVVLMHPDYRELFAGNRLLMGNPYLGYARLTALFDPRPKPPVGQHPSAVVGEGCQLGAGVSIGPHAVIGAGAVLEPGVEIGPGTSVGAGSVVGANSYLAANVSVYHGVVIGADCIIHSGAVIGSDGFGFAPDKGRWQKIHQLGGVVIGSGVEIGAGTAIDRGALTDTVIADGVKIDNQVHIAHNVRIGKNTAIAANSAIAGSTSLGENCTVAGCVGIAGHVTIVDGVHISGMSMVTSSVSEPGSYSSGIPLSPSAEWRKNAVRFKQLNAMAARLKQLESDRDN